MYILYFRDTEYLYNDFVNCDSTEKLSGLLADLLDWSMSKPEMLAHFQVIFTSFSHCINWVRKGAYSFM